MSKLSWKGAPPKADSIQVFAGVMDSFCRGDEYFDSKCVWVKKKQHHLWQVIDSKNKGEKK